MSRREEVGTVECGAYDPASGSYARMLFPVEVIEDDDLGWATTREWATRVRLPLARRSFDAVFSAMRALWDGVAAAGARPVGFTAGPGGLVVNFRFDKDCTRKAVATLAIEAAKRCAAALEASS